MKRKQIALLLSLVLSVSPMAEGAVVWGADFTDGTAIEQTQQEETTEEVSDFDSEETVFSAGKEQNMEAAAFSDENVETGESRYEVGLNYDTGTANLLPGYTVTVGVDLYRIYADEDGNEKGASSRNACHHQRSDNHHTLRDVLQGDTEGYPPLRCSLCRTDTHSSSHAFGQFM